MIFKIKRYVLFKQNVYVDADSKAEAIDLYEKEDFLSEEDFSSTYLDVTFNGSSFHSYDDDSDSLDIKLINDDDIEEDLDEDGDDLVREEFVFEKGTV
jgi:hypothetical protein